MWFLSSWLYDWRGCFFQQGTERLLEQGSICLQGSERGISVCEAAHSLGMPPPPCPVWYSHLVGAGVHEAKTLQFNSCRDPGLVELWILTFSIVGQVTETKLLDFTFVNIPGYLTDLINVYSNIWRNKGHCSILLGMKACLSTGKNGFLNCWFATCVWDFACECW